MWHVRCEVWGMRYGVSVACVVWGVSVACEVWCVGCECGARGAMDLDMRGLYLIMHSRLQK